MIKQIFILLAVFCTLIVSAQDNTSSPYSYFGIGLPTFNGTTETKSMQGLSIEADSTRYNLQNPASLGRLHLTTFSVGVTQKFNNMANAQDKESVRNTTFDYIGIGIPVGKINFGLGIIPETTMGYKLRDATETHTSNFSGRGGLNRLSLSAGYQIHKNLSIGVEGDYNFGNVQNENILFQKDIQYGTREKNRSDLSGFSFKLGAQYETRLSKNLWLHSAISYAPKLKLDSENFRKLATIQANGSVINENEIDLANTSFYTPSDLRIGAGIGEGKKWLVGLEYQNIGKASYTNTSFSPNNITYKQANAYRIGGYYIPNYRDITNYFSRITLRAGVRYQETGMTINQEDIDEFGISFGLGLPAGRYMSSINIGAEYGQRGTTAAGLIKEEFINIYIGISLSDKWFIQKKFR
ncbi:MAG TPA: hypothetical protein VK021_02185 [Flavobacteriaceae bacterium]|nr:hypothetical protein [Flavobacteriaceae bacterium]